jgi:hypothetical protein
LPWRRRTWRASSVDAVVASAYRRTIVSWDWRKWPPVMERTLVDDLRWAAFVFTGAILGYFAFARGNTSLLLGSFLGLVLAIVVLNVVRRIWRRRNA